MGKCMVAVARCLFLCVLAPSIAVAQIPQVCNGGVCVVTISAQSDNDYGAWQWAYHCVEPGHLLIFTDESVTI
jgi:hypothetical protein